MHPAEEQERIIAMVIRWRTRGFTHETCVQKLMLFGYDYYLAVAFVDKAIKRIAKG